MGRINTVSQKVSRCRTRGRSEISITLSDETLINPEVQTSATKGPTNRLVSSIKSRWFSASVTLAGRLTACDADLYL